ncbi:hypothetical protein [Gordonia soli]|uniref:Uncharacterized protein n=1 Tax=Gordonia soli NBRC 108243 TaxID=1223545 RepID=M0QJZ3_9ACTN|nr:hypothetical protein [Gordonia soli]GAC68935.1 hypothetical protein GS4_19_01250 [Gordonia soli NBRC 108243]
MLASVLFVPSAPLLVPELTGPAAADTEPIRAAVISAATELAVVTPHWIAIGVGDVGVLSSVGAGVTTAHDDMAAPDVSLPPSAGSVHARSVHARSVHARSGTFRAYGVDVAVSLDGPAALDGTAASGFPAPDGPDGREAAPLRLPLSMLVAGWLRGQVGAGPVETVVVAPDATPADCARQGAGIADRLQSTDDPVGVVVVGDGATALSAKAPGGGLRQSSVALQERIDRALATADVAALESLDVTECAAGGVSGRAAWQVAAALGASYRAIRVWYADAPFGVGYDVVTWEPSR